MIKPDKVRIRVEKKFAGFAARSNAEDTGVCSSGLGKRMGEKTKGRDEESSFGNMNIMGCRNLLTDAKRGCGLRNQPTANMPLCPDTAEMSGAIIGLV
jgi:hypothetical protein